MKVYVIEEFSCDPYESHSIIKTVFTDKTIAEAFVDNWNKLADEVNDNGQCWDSQWKLFIKEVELNEFVKDTPTIQHNILIYLESKYFNYDCYVAEKVESDVSYHKDYLGEEDESIMEVTSIISQKDVVSKAKSWLIGNGYDLNEFTIEFDHELSIEDIEIADKDSMLI